MTSLKLRLAATLAVLLTLAPFFTAPANSATLSYSVSNENTMIALTNKSRAAYGLRGYRVSSELARVARAQAMRMATKNRLYHNPNLRYAVSNYRWVGENVGYSPDAYTLQRAFMKSPSHRANVLNHKYTQVGIGAVVVGGRLWVSAVFRQPQ